MSLDIQDMRLQQRGLSDLQWKYVWVNASFEGLNSLAFPDGRWQRIPKVISSDMVHGIAHIYDVSLY